MSRNSAALALLLCLTLAFAALAESDSLIPEDKIATNTVNYNTITVAPGVFERRYTLAAEIVHPCLYNLRFETDGAKFVEYRVASGDVVRKGDVLAAFEPITDPVALAEQQLKLARTREETEAQTEAMEEELEALYETLPTTTDRFEADMLALRITRAEIALKQYADRQARQIAAIEKAIGELEAERANDALTAPMDGVILRVSRKQSGDRVSDGETLVTLYRPDVLLLRVENGYANLRYGMEVDVEYGRANHRETLPGRVVGADTLLPASAQDGFAYVEFDSDLTEEELINPKILVTSMRLDGVLTLPRAAVELEKGKYYVMKLADGIAQKRFIQCVLNGQGPVWVVQGLEPGEEIIVD